MNAEPDTTSPQPELGLPATSDASPVADAAAADATLSPSSDGEDIALEEERRLLAPTGEADKPMTVTPDGQIRKPDGTFGPKGDPEPKATPPAPVTPTLPAATPTPVPTPAPVVPAVPAPVVPPVPTFDAKGLVEGIMRDVMFKATYKDGGENVTGEKLFADYGQVMEPMRDVIVELAKTMESRFQDALKPVLTQAEKAMVAERNAAEEAVFTALEGAGVTDARTLAADSRVLGFVAKNPQYGAMLSTDVSRVDDVKFVLDRARAALGIAAPAAVAPAKAVVAPRPPTPRSVQAGISGLRGAGHGGGESTQSVEDIELAEERRLIERAKREREG